MSDRVPPHNVDAEASVLGGVFLTNKALGDALERGLVADDFYLPQHRAIFEVMIELDAESKPIDLLTVPERLSCKGENRSKARVDEKILTDLAARVPTAANVGYYARIVKETSSLRKLIAASGNVISKAYDKPADVERFLDWAEGHIGEAATRTNQQSYVRMSQTILGVAEAIARRYDRGGTVTGVTTGYVDLDRKLAGLQPSDLIILAARPSMGKAQPLDALVKMRDGSWKTMGTICIGDALASYDGTPSYVTHIHRQGFKKVYRVSFSDGRKTECCNDHLWLIRHNRGCGLGIDESNNPRLGYVRETHPLSRVRSMISMSRYKNRIWTDTVSGEFGCDDGLSVNPWVLGVLLGDGNFTGPTVRLTTADREIAERVGLLLGPMGRISKHKIKYQYGIVSFSAKSQNQFTMEIESLGLKGKNSYNKFIPRAYLESSKHSRLELLRGLLDTDGWVQSGNGSSQICYATSSPLLRDGVIELVRSLGGVGNWWKRITSYTLRGKKTKSNPSYVICISNLEKLGLFTLSRKSSRVIDRRRISRSTIKSIRLVGEKECQCITVSHPEGLYITNDYIVTHNSALALNMARNAAVEAGIPSLIFSLEMSKESLSERMLCLMGNLDSQDVRTGRLDAHGWATMNEKASRICELPVYVDDSSSLTLLEIRAKARKWRRDREIFPKGDEFGMVIIDYLQLVDGGGEHREDSREREVTKISQGLKALAKELKLPVMALSQLNRKVEQRENKHPNLSDLRESGSLEQDADVVMFIYRDSVYDESKKDDKTAEVIVAKQRNGPIGTVELCFLDYCGRFENMDGRREDWGR